MREKNRGRSADATTIACHTPRPAFRRRHASPAAAMPANARVPGSGTADGVNVRNRVLPGWSRCQPKEPPLVAFWNSAVSKTVAAVNAASLIGPAYVVAHWTNGQA